MSLFTMLPPCITMHHTCDICWLDRACNADFNDIVIKTLSSSWARYVQGKWGNAGTPYI
jgi:hypothetical protein